MARTEKGVQDSNSIFVNEFNEYGVKAFREQFELLRATNQPVIPVYIDSFGGEIYSLLAILDIMESSDRPVATIALGKAMSCGSILLSAGHPGLRFVGKNSTIMIHDAATVSFGKLEELKADVGEVERLNDLIFGILDNKCGQKSGYFGKLIEQKKHANWFLTPEEAKRHRLVDVIGLPVLNFNYSFEIQGGVKGKKASK